MERKHRHLLHSGKFKNPTDICTINGSQRAALEPGPNSLNPLRDETTRVCDKPIRLAELGSGLPPGVLRSDGLSIAPADVQSMSHSKTPGRFQVVQAHPMADAAFLRFPQSAARWAFRRTPGATTGGQLGRGEYCPIWPRSRDNFVTPQCLRLRTMCCEVFDASRCQHRGEANRAEV